MVTSEGAELAADTVSEDQKVAPDSAPAEFEDIPTFLDRRGEQAGRTTTEKAVASPDTVPARPSWRDHLPVHPAADLFPLMSESELRELGEDIKANGLQSPIVVLPETGDDYKLIDGRNRLDAMALVGIDFKIERARRRGVLLHPHLAFSDKRISNHMDYERRPNITVLCLYDDEILNFVLSANLHRRHLTGEQKRELIAKVLKAKPEASNVVIAKQVKADDKTVAKVRRKLESTSEIPKLEKTTGADGKQRKSRAKKKSKPEPVKHHVTGPAEISEDQRRAENARLADDDLPTEEEADESWQNDLYEQACLLLSQMADATKQRFFASIAEYDITEADCEDCDSNEQRWRNSVGNLAGDSIAMEAYWKRQFGEWEKFKASSSLVKLVEQAAEAWSELAQKLETAP